YNCPLGTIVDVWVNDAFTTFTASSSLSLGANNGISYSPPLGSVVEFLCTGGANGTDQALLISPITSGKIVLGSAYTNSTVTASAIFSIPVGANQSNTIHCHGLYQVAASGYFGLTITGPASPLEFTYDFNKGTTSSSNAITYL